MFGLFRRMRPCHRDDDPQRLERPGRPCRGAGEGERHDDQGCEAEAAGHRGKYTVGTAPSFKGRDQSPYLLALCTLTSGGFRMPGRVMRWRIVGRDSLDMGGSETGLPDLADL